MCLATPVKLIKVEEGRGTVGGGGSEYEVKLDLIDQPQVGDWLLCHADLAVNRIPEEEAQSILALIGECPCYHDH